MLTKDLHCWEAFAKLQKLGTRWSYDFEVRIKKLPDLKVGKGTFGQSACRRLGNDEHLPRLDLSPAPDLLRRLGLRFQVMTPVANEEPGRARTQGRQRSGPVCSRVRRSQGPLGALGRTETGLFIGVGLR